MQPNGLPQGMMLVPIPEKKKFRITAVIPTVQYGNIQPEYEVEAETFEQAQEIAMPYIESLWAKYCAKGSELPQKAPAEEAAATSTAKVKYIKMVSPINDVALAFDPIAHKYVNKEGKQYISGSVFAHKYQHEFNGDQIIPDMAKKHGVSEDDIKSLWEIKGEASSSLGTAIHAALEMFGKFHALGEKLGSTKKPICNTALHDQPILKAIVEKFFKDRMHEDAEYEVFIADEKLMWCGQIDRLLITDRKKQICRIQDYKTNFDVNKKGFNGKLLAPFDDMPDTPLSGYWLQLSFYARIMQNAGWTVEGLDVLHFDGNEWVTYTREVIDLTDF